MSGTAMQTPGTGNGRTAGRRPLKATRVRRTKAQLAQARANTPAAAAQPAAAAAIAEPLVVRGDPATDFAADTIAELYAKPPAVRDRAAMLIGKVCARLLKAA